MQQLQLLAAYGPLLARCSTLEELAECAVTAGMELSGAAAGAFFDFTDAKASSGLASLRWSEGVGPQLWQTLLPHLSAMFPSAATPASTPRCADLVSAAAGGSEFQALSRAGGMRGCLAVEIPCRSGEARGTLVFTHADPLHFQADQRLLLQSIAAQTGVVAEVLSLSVAAQGQSARVHTARAAQRSTERRLLEALECAQLGTWDWSSSTDLVSFDERAASLFGVPAGVSVSRTELREQVVNREDQQRGLPDLRRILQGGERYAAEYRISLPDGSERWIASSGIPIFDEQAGRPTGMTGCVKDITEQKSQEAALRQSEKLAATGRLAATIAHEINNPLEAVTNLIYLAKTDPITPAPIEKLLETADSELARVSHIAQQTLVFYRDTTRPANVDLNELLQAVVDLFGRKLATKHLQCILDLDPGLSVVGLQGELRQVVSNLLVNAIDASSPRGGSIRIRARHRDRNGKRGVCVLISDQGAGIPSHVRNRLFTPFVTTKQAHGTGLGLWVTRGMVERHGGSVRFRSRTDQPTGTVFCIYLPHRGTTELFASPSAAVLQ